MPFACFATKCSFARYWSSDLLLWSWFAKHWTPPSGTFMRLRVNNMPPGLSNLWPRRWSAGCVAHCARLGSRYLLSLCAYAIRASLSQRAPRFTHWLCIAFFGFRECTIALIVHEEMNILSAKISWKTITTDGLFWLSWAKFRLVFKIYLKCWGKIWK